MSEEQYYTPVIEDICSGYEYEVNDGGKWEKITEFSNAYLYDDNPHYAIMKDIEAGKIRVPYLTKEQIEAEGWKHQCQVDDDTYRFTKKSGVEHHHINFSLEIDFRRKFLSITTGPQDYILTKNCKSINEFRTIIKLLEI